MSPLILFFIFLPFMVFAIFGLLFAVLQELHDWANPILERRLALLWARVRASLRR